MSGDPHSPWLEMQKNALSQFQSGVNNYSDNTRDYWKMLVGLHGTILGLSAAFLQFSQFTPSLLMIIAWAVQLLAIGLGLSILYFGNEQALDESLLSYRFSYNMSEIQLMVSQRKLEQSGEKHAGLVSAALYERTPQVFHNVFTDYIKLQIQKYKSELPANSHTTVRKRGCVRTLIDKHWLCIVKSFYWLTFIVFVLLFAAVVSVYLCRCGS